MHRCYHQFSLSIFSSFINPGMFHFLVFLINNLQMNMLWEGLNFKTRYSFLPKRFAVEFSRKYNWEYFYNSKTRVCSLTHSFIFGKHGDESAADRQNGMSYFVCKLRFARNSRLNNPLYFIFALHKIAIFVSCLNCLLSSGQNKWKGFPVKLDN